MKEDLFEWIFKETREPLPEVMLCREILMQLMYEVTWHKIILTSISDKGKKVRVKYLRSIEALEFVNDNSYRVFSFTHLCEVAGCNPELIRMYTKLHPRHLFKQFKFYKYFLCRVRRYNTSYFDEEKQNKNLLRMENGHKIGDYIYLYIDKLLDHNINIRSLDE